MKVICVINDQPAHLALTMVHLLRLDYGVVACRCDRALVFLQQVHPDMIFLEVEPPASKEAALIQEIRLSLKLEIPIVILSPTVQSDLAGAVLEAGADAIYPHPKDLSQLSTLLAQYLDDNPAEFA